MTKIQKRLINAYTVLVLAERMDISEVPETPLTLDDGGKGSIRSEVEIKIAKKTIEVLG